MSESGKVLISQAFQAIETQATDEFFRNDIGIRGASVAWLAGMREKSQAAMSG